AQRPEILVALEHGQEVIARELADDAREHAAAVGQEDLGLAEAAGVEEDLTGRGVAGVILEADADVEVAERDPDRLAAPAHVDDLLLERQQLRERRARLGRALFLQAGAEAERTGGDRQHCHGLSVSIVGVKRRPAGGPTIRPSANTVRPRTSVRTTWA